MKRVTAALAIALCAASFSSTKARDAQTAVNNHPPYRAYGINGALDYRFPVTPRSHTFVPRNHRHAHFQRHGFRPLPLLRGPAVIYRNGEIGIPPEDEITAAIPAVAHPVIYRLGETGGCGLQQVNVPGGRGRTTVNIWRC